MEINVHDIEMNMGRSWAPAYNFDSLLDQDGNSITVFSDAIDLGMTISGTVDTDNSGVYEITYSYEDVSATVTVSIIGIEFEEQEELEPLEFLESAITPIDIGTITDPEPIQDKLDRIEGKVDTILSLLQSGS